MDSENSFPTEGDKESEDGTKKLSGDSDSPIHKKLKYDEEYITFGFTWIGDENGPKGEAYSIAESLLKPCVKDVVATMIGGRTC
ncbi:hypothetical protein NPIL_301181 [Nephila pilipes]|uniref:Uncharacterized protein n=1 Tax=Nephila pilipes TaxID=299642 RepID=A0A8X6PMN6_NEPPI|nr:hypothetical protein NPIL_301181 [Nephila pilipes]